MFLHALSLDPTEPPCDDDVDAETHAHDYDYDYETTDDVPEFPSNRKRVIWKTHAHTHTHTHTHTHAVAFMCRFESPVTNATPSVPFLPPLCVCWADALALGGCVGRGAAATTQIVFVKNLIR